MAFVRVRVLPDPESQHFTDAPKGNQVTREWEGETLCGARGRLRWIHLEVVDEGATCEACATVAGTYKPLLEGDYPGPP